ncbi:MAG TPA: class I SAM-dependent methyltransferase [Planctomycetota bacterium]|nr:class I SAM-dependent methyltransferase [Planctomycetota bacterium]
MADPRRVYYDHEPAYKRILAKGGRGWDDLSPGKDPRSYVQLERFLATVEKRPGQKALDLGCGGGQASLLLARLGFETTGVDYSETAIELARKNAREAGLGASFEVGDCLALSCVEPGTMDLVIDNHVLHCIVEPEDRARFLGSARRALKRGGTFFSDTMSGEAGFDVARFEVDPATRIAKNRTRIWVTRAELNAELERAGFRVLRQEVVPDEEPGNPSDIVTVAEAV